MGRTAKHLTLQEKLEARKAAKRRYAASVRGLQTKSEQNARAYRQRVAQQGSQNKLPTLDDMPGNIPLPVISLAQQPLQSSNLFRQALQGPNELDESELGIWDARPPYHTLPAHQEDECKLRFTDKLVQVMNGKRLRELRSDGEDRHDRVESEGALTIVRELEEQVKELMVICRDDKPAAIASVSLPGSSRDLRMAHLHYEWAARRLYCLHYELLVLGADVRKFREMYSCRELAWQKVVVVPA